MAYSKKRNLSDTCANEKYQKERGKMNMWKLYQKCGSIKEVAKKVKRDRSTVSRYVHEFEAAVGAQRGIF